MSKQEHCTNQFTTKGRTHVRHINPFDLLYNEPKCYVCHNFGHKASNYHMKNYKTKPRMNYSAENAKVWKKRESNMCGLILYALKKKDP